MSDIAEQGTGQDAEGAPAQYPEPYVPDDGEDRGAGTLIGTVFELDGTEYRVVSSELAPSPLVRAYDGAGVVTTYTNIFMVTGQSGAGEVTAYICRLCGTAFRKRGQATWHLGDCKTTYGLTVIPEETSTEPDGSARRIKLSRVTRDMTLGEVVDLARKVQGLEAANDTLRNALHDERTQRRDLQNVLVGLQNAFGRLNGAK